MEWEGGVGGWSGRVEWLGKRVSGTKSGEKNGIVGK